MIHDRYVWSFWDFKVFYFSILVSSWVADLVTQLLVAAHPILSLGAFWTSAILAVGSQVEPCYINLFETARMRYCSPDLIDKPSQLGQSGAHTWSRYPTHLGDIFLNTLLTCRHQCEASNATSVLNKPNTSQIHSSLEVGLSTAFFQQVPFWRPKIKTQRHKTFAYFEFFWPIWHAAQVLLCICDLRSPKLL